MAAWYTNGCFGLTHQNLSIVILAGKCPLYCKIPVFRTVAYIFEFFRSIKSMELSNVKHWVVNVLVEKKFKGILYLMQSVEILKPKMRFEITLCINTIQEAFNSVNCSCWVCLWYEKYWGSVTYAKVVDC